MKIVRLHVNLAEDTADALQAYARAHGCSVTEATRRAVSLLNLCDVEMMQGHNLAFIKKVKTFWGTKARLVKTFGDWNE